MGTVNRPYACFLTMHHHLKPIPYPAVDRGVEGKNHGFIALKGGTGPSPLIPEAQGDQALNEALTALNAASSPFFTVGCEKALNKDDSGFWKRGYLEFAFNDSVLSSDSRNYFALFQGFSERLNRLAFKTPLSFEWEIEQAVFVAADTGGWTVSVWIATPVAATENEAHLAWAIGMGTLVEALTEIDVPITSPIYPVPPIATDDI
jgi:hypothetical protein